MNNQSGSIFFYILLAIVLFAALSYAVSMGNRGNTSTMTDQQAKLAAQEIIEYGQTVANAVQKLKLRGFQDTEIDFKNDVWSTCDNTFFYSSGNVNLSTETNQLFNLNGGNISIRTFDYGVVTKDSLCTPCPLCTIPGHLQGSSISVQDIGTSDPDLVLLFSGISESTCNSINKILGINDGTSVPTDTVAGAWRYNGNYGGTGLIGDEATELAGKTAFCTRSTVSPERFSYWQVLIAR